MTSLASHDSMSVFIQLSLHYEHCEIIVWLWKPEHICSNVREEMPTLAFVMVEVRIWVEAALSVKSKRDTVQGILQASASQS